MKDKKILKIVLLIFGTLLVLFIIWLLVERLNKCNNMYEDKPVIYLYPKEETKVIVKLGKEENITCSYPEYEDEWNVTAYPNGILMDNNTGRKLYSLYWEGIVSDLNITNEGFIVKGKDTISFLEEKLATLGLNEIEIEEFIIYWLPKLQNNKYNYIRFASVEEIDVNMPLKVYPTPDTVIRVLMIYKGLDRPINIKEQNLQPISRNGFTVVEWGGTEIIE